jgi:hypothetical protein
MFELKFHPAVKRDLKKSGKSVTTHVLQYPPSNSLFSSINNFP